MKRGMILGLFMVGMALTHIFNVCEAAEVAGKPEEFFKGKTITIVVPYDPGGAYDSVPRVFAPYFAKYTGASMVIVENMPGAGGLKGMNHMYIKAKPDGLTLSSFAGDTAMLSQLLRKPEVKYDVAKYSYVGRWFREDEGIGIGMKVPYTTPKDLRSLKELKMGTMTAASGMAFTMGAFANAFDLNMKLIPGYSGTMSIIPAIAGGELHGTGTGISTLKRYADQGMLRLVCVLSSERSVESPDVPTIHELAKQMGEGLKGEKAKWVELRQATLELTRELLGPPGIPLDRLKFLRQAFTDAVQDKDFRVAMAKVGFEIRNVGRGEDLEKAAKFKMTEAELTSFTDFLTKRYIKR